MFAAEVHRPFSDPAALWTRVQPWVVVPPRNTGEPRRTGDWPRAATAQNFPNHKKKGGTPAPDTSRARAAVCLKLRPSARIHTLPPTTKEIPSCMNSFGLRCSTIATS